jgi:hypothetical protein
LDKIFKLSIFLEKPPKPAVQKSIAKVSSVPTAAVQIYFLNGRYVASDRPSFTAKQHNDLTHITREKAALL